MQFLTGQMDIYKVSLLFGLLFISLGCLAYLSYKKFEMVDKALKKNEADMYKIVLFLKQMNAVHHEEAEHEHMEEEMMEEETVEVQPEPVMEKDLETIEEETVEEIEQEDLDMEVEKVEEELKEEKKSRRKRKKVTIEEEL